MAVANIDTVYQRVLALANKEQRGYITPQEFNLLAGKAQNDIFEMYFNDYKTALLSSGNKTKASDDGAKLEQKINIHRKTGQAVIDGTTLPGDVHYLESVYNDDSTYGRVAIEEVSVKDFHQMKSNPKLSPMGSRPVFYREGSSETNITISPTQGFRETTIECPGGSSINDGDRIEIADFNYNSGTGTSTVFFVFNEDADFFDTAIPGDTTANARFIVDIENGHGPDAVATTLATAMRVSNRFNNVSRNGDKVTFEYKKILDSYSE
ncbi:MAG: hypothetical protein NZ811_07785, partial [Gammaproteobacteria bacterium]|nr:hypothetical protein [Gammaproteobacteria bacterium]